MIKAKREGKQLKSEKKNLERKKEDNNGNYSPLHRQWLKDILALLE